MAEQTPSAPGSRRSSLPKNFRRNLITNYLRTGSTAVITLVMTPVLVAGLGTEAFGVWVIVNSLAVYRDLLHFGFVAATPKYVAEHTARGDREGVRTAIATTFWILAGLGTVALLIGLGLAALLPHLFEIPPDLRTAAQVLMLMMVVDFALSIPCAVFGGTLMGLQRYDLLNATQVAVVLSQAIGWAIVLALGGGLVSLGVVTVALSLTGQLARYVIVRRLVPGLSVSPGGAKRSLFRPFAGFSIWLAIEDAGYILINRIDVIVVGLVLGVRAAAVYGVAQRLTIGLGQLVDPISSLFFPHSSELAARQDAAGLRRGVLTGTRIQLAIAAPLAMAVAILAAPILETWVGSGFSSGVPVAILLSAAVVVWVVSDIPKIILMGSGRARRPALIRAGEAVLNVSLSIVLAHLIGLEGVALATLIAAVTANLLILFPYVCEQFGVSLRELAGSMLVAHLPAAGCSLLVGLLLSRADLVGILPLAAAAASILVTYLVVLVLTGLDTAERHALLERARFGA